MSCPRLREREKETYTHRANHHPRVTIGTLFLCGLVLEHLDDDNDDDNCDDNEEEPEANPSLLACCTRRVDGFLRVIQPEKGTH